MNRRSFLKSLFGAAAVAAVPKTIYVFAPPSGWELDSGGLYMNNASWDDHGCITLEMLEKAFAQIRWQMEHPIPWQSRGLIEYGGIVRSTASPANLSAYQDPA